MPQNIYLPIDYLQDIAINNDLDLFIEYNSKNQILFWNNTLCKKMRVKNNCTKLQLEFILISLSYGEVFPSRLFSSFCGSVTKAFSLMLYFSKLDFLLERCCIKIKIIFWAAECNSQHGILKSNNEVEDVTKNPFLGKNLKTWWYVRVYICLTKKSLKC